MKKRAKQENEKQVKPKKSCKKNTRASTKPESRKSVVSVFEHLSFAANVLEAEKDEDRTLSEEYAYEQGKSQMVQQRGNGTHEPVFFDDLLFLANTAGAEESLPIGDACNKRGSREMDRLGSCFGLPEKVQRTRKSTQQRGKAAFVEEDTVNRDPCDGCRKGKLFEKKYVRKKRESTSVRAVAGTSKVVKRSRKNKPKRFVNVNDIHRGEDGKTRSKAGLLDVVDKGIKNRMRSRVENAEVTGISSIIPHILGIKNQEISKRKRSQRKGRPREPEKNSCETREEKEQVCDQTDSHACVSETFSETANKVQEEEEEEENIVCIAGSEIVVEAANKVQEEEEENTICEGDLETEAETHNDANKPEEENIISEGESEIEKETDNEANKLQEEEEENTSCKANSETVAEEVKDVQKPQKEESRSEFMKQIVKVLNKWYDDGEEEEDNEPQEEEEEDDSNRADVYKEIMLLLKYKYGNAEKEKAIVSEQETSPPLTEVAEEGVSNASSCKWWNFKTRSRSRYGIRKVPWSIKKKRNCMTSHETLSNRKILLLALETVTPQLGMLKISNEVTTKKKRRRRRAL